MSGSDRTAPTALSPGQPLLLQRLRLCCLAWACLPLTAHHALLTPYPERQKAERSGVPAKLGDPQEVAPRHVRGPWEGRLQPHALHIPEEMH